MHNIEYFSYDENIHRDFVYRELNTYVQNETRGEGGGGLYHGIRWLGSVGICSTYEDAMQSIKDRDRGDYDQLAVRYYEPARGFSNKKLEELKAKERAALDAYREKDSVYAKGLKAEYISCKKCGSKLKREYLNTNRCPVCKADLRPESILKAVNSAMLRWKKAEAERNCYYVDHAKKKVKWLVKIEYHT